MMDGILRRVSKMPEQRSLYWILIVIMIVCGIPGLANATPKADFTYRFLAADWVQFDGSPSSDPAGIAVYSWHFDEQAPEISSTDPVINHTFTYPTTYHVTLRVTSKASPPETGNITKSVEVVYMICTPPACPPPGVYACPDRCPGGCGTVCETKTPLGIGPVVVALAGVVILLLRRRVR